MFNKRISFWATALVVLLLLIKFTGISANEQNLLTFPWKLTGNNNAAEAYQPVPKDVLKNAQGLKLTYNLHGLCVLPGDASAIIFDQNGWKTVSLAQWGQNCKDGTQTVVIPLSAFKDINTKADLDLSKPLTGLFHTRIWANKSFTVEITQAVIQGKTMPDTPAAPQPSTPLPTSPTTPSTFPTPTPVNQSPITGLSEGQTVRGSLMVGYLANPDTTTSVDFLIDNSLKTTERFSPYYLGGDNGGTPVGWDSRQLNDGYHTLAVKLNKKDATTQVTQMGFRVANNGTVSTLPNITPTGTPNSSPTIPAISPTVTPTPTPTRAVTASPLPSPTARVSATPAPTSSSWSIRSVDSMKDTKDAICGQRSDAWINQWLDQAVQLNANYVAISMPYENPSCGNSVDYAKRWIRAIRAHGLKVWHRQMPLSFEGIYSVTKSRQDFLTQIATYIKNNPDNYVDGDIFTPIPEPQNGGISGITYCANGLCQWDNKETFNKWLRDAITTSRSAFQSVGKNNMKIGYYGFDGFVAWGANNPDWNGILEDATVTAMGNITIDHYPELIGTDMATDIAELEARYPGVDIIMGEWGTVTGGNTEATVNRSMGALKRPSVKGFNYWQFGPSGAGEQLINDDFSHRAQFDEVKNMYSQ